LLSADMVVFCRRGIYGGRCYSMYAACSSFELKDYTDNKHKFHGAINDHLEYLDVNNLYAYVMREELYPYGQAEYIKDLTKVFSLLQDGSLKSHGFIQY
jgi:hypothetical protein